MSISRICGDEDLYLGSVFAFRGSGRLLSEYHITHVLSVIAYDLHKDGRLDPAHLARLEHLSIDLDDMDYADLLRHLPRTTRFIERGLYGGNGPTATATAAAATEPGQTTGGAKGAVLVHCAMGKSRSVAAVVAWLLYQHGGRYGDQKTEAGQVAVGRALAWVRMARPGAEPNAGFTEQLGLWWEWGTPCGSDDAVERLGRYRKWKYGREVAEAARCGRAPEMLRFEDEAAGDDEGRQTGQDGLAARCKKCRRTLATGPFVVRHGRGREPEKPSAACGHVFIEPLSWMRPMLETGALGGRLACPNAKCGALVGRFAWQGFACSCGEWVCPAFSLQRSKIDESRLAPTQALAAAVDGSTPAGGRKNGGKM